MFTTRSISIRVLLVLCSITQLVVWSGCSRMMSPPGQRIFFKNEPKAADQYDWNLSSTQVESTPDAADSMQSQSNFGDQNSVAQSSQEALQQQYAQSYQVPETVPPRLIPIESVPFPGDRPQEVIQASATLADQPANRESLAVEFSDASTTSSATNNGATQANLLRDQAAAGVTSTGRSVADQQKTELPASQPKTKINFASTVPTSSSVTPGSKDPRLNYNRSAASVNATAPTSTFVPGEFQADRRAAKPESKEASPSDIKPSQVNVATKEKAPSNSISPVADTVANPSKLATTANLSIQPTTASGSTTGALKIDAPETAKSTELKQSKPVSSVAAQAPANPTKSFAKPALTGEAALMAAGIKVDKNAFEISIPGKKNVESSKPKADTQAVNMQVRPKPKAGTTPHQTVNNSLPLTSKTNPAPQPQISSSTKDATCATKQNCETLSSITKSSPDFSGAVASKLEGMIVSSNKADGDSRSPNAKKEEQGSKATTSAAPITSTLPNPSTVPAISQFVPTQTPGLASKPVDPIKNASSAAPNSFPSKNIPNLTTSIDQAASANILSAPAKSGAGLNSGQLAAKTPAVAKTNLSLSELDLLDRNFPASPPSGRKPTPPSLTPSNPSSSMVTPIPSQFGETPPQLAVHTDAKPVKALPLQLVNSQFCTEIKGFGQVKPFESTQFKGNQRTLVYCEVENYNSQTRTTDKGTEYVTRFRGSYQILDSKGSVVQSGQFPEIEDVTVRKRRDFYLYFPITFKNLQQADYELKLIIEESTPNSTGKETAVRVAGQVLPFAVDQARQN